MRLGATGGGKNLHTVQMNRCPPSCGELVDIWSSLSSRPRTLRKLLSFLLSFHFPLLHSMLQKIPINCNLDDAPLCQATSVAAHCSGTKILAPYHEQRSVTWPASPPTSSLPLARGAHPSHVLPFFPALQTHHALSCWWPFTCPPHRPCLCLPHGGFLPPLVICITPSHSSSCCPISFS